MDRIFRTLLLLHIVDMLVDTKIGPPQPSGCLQLNGILLPCRKEMWQAETSSAWEVEYKQYLRTRKSGEMLNYSHLRLMKGSDLDGVESDVIGDLSTWSKGVDGLGALILMAIQR
jgi:hypothetical protein